MLTSRITFTNKIHVLGLRSRKLRRRHQVVVLIDRKIQFHATH